MAKRIIKSFGDHQAHEVNKCPHCVDKYTTPVLKEYKVSVMDGRGRYPSVLKREYEVHCPNGHLSTERHTSELDAICEWNNISLK